ncbi:protein lingerer-like [Pollicipes pollicipes]|uniref:protein lingerer-like n=1 Tax=Pollicipes pollicipes TaxID=41117 RepID=UPI0018849213|nr:protein lingerer-like [Pollicipes pollicipes]
MSSGGRSSTRSAGRSKAERGPGREARPAADPAAPHDKLKPHTNAKPREDKMFEDKISQVIQLTGKTKDEAEIALFDCDYDPTRAINMLLEGDDQGEWVEKTKKKKLPKPAPADQKVPEESAGPKEEERDRDRDRDRSRSRGGQPPRLRRGAAQDRSWKARESRENEKNAADGGDGEGRPRWAGRGGGARGGRGGRRGALGSRSFQTRRGDDFAAIDTWTNPGDERGGRGRSRTQPGGGWDQGFPAADDWDNEEWGGSLTDTKVFTPSAPVQPAAPAAGDTPVSSTPAPPPASTLGPSLDLRALLGKAPAAGEAGGDAPTYSQFAATPADGGRCLSYSSGYTSDSFASQLKSSLAPSEPVSTATSMSQSLPQRSKVQKPRMQPPSKIPESAVEMPGDPVSSLGVKFGGLDFGTSDSKPFQTPDGDADAFSSGVASSARAP